MLTTVLQPTPNNSGTGGGLSQSGVIGVGVSVAGSVVAAILAGGIKLWFHRK
jgi:hypothetical protein